MSNKTMNSFKSLPEASSSIYPRFSGGGATSIPRPLTLLAPRKPLGFSDIDEEMASAVIPPVTVVLEGRSICHRIHLQEHSSYQSLAKALRRLFVDNDGDLIKEGDDGNGGDTLDLTNAVPGFIVAYEDMEDDLLLAGDLKWKDFVRVAKRIRLLPAKSSGRKHNGGLQI